MWKSIRTTNALENLNREFRRRTKTQASFTTEASAVALLFGLVARVRSDYDASMVTSTSPTFLLEARSPFDLIPSRRRGEAPFFFHEIRYASAME